MPPSHVLLIEDNEDCAILLRRLITHLWERAQVTCLGTLEDSVKFLRAFLPEIVVTDLYIPYSPSGPVGTDPKFVIDTLLRCLPIPTALIAISGYFTPLEGQEMLSLGADAFIAKGVSFQEMARQLVEGWLRSQGRQRRWSMDQLMLQRDDKELQDSQLYQDAHDQYISPLSPRRSVQSFPSRNTIHPTALTPLLDIHSGPTPPRKHLVNDSEDYRSVAAAHTVPEPRSSVSGFHNRP